MNNKLLPKFLLFFIMGIIAIALIGRTLWLFQIQPPRPFSKDIKNFSIAKGESINSTADRLEKEGLIKNSLSFKILVKLFSLDKNIQAGEYRLSPSMNAEKIAKSLTFGTFDVWITVPEGLRKEEIAEKLEKSLNINKEEFINEAEEGYTFPDTYSIPKGTPVKTVVKMVRDNFDKKIASLPSSSLSLKEVIILASIVEREAKHDQDRPIVAGILKKRYQKGWPLEADATIQYALGYDEIEKTWWRKKLSTEDLQIDSPYNTRINPGLPPTPICNPGLAAINAVVTPKETSYWYYLSDQKNNMHYATTLDAHNQNIEKYLQQ